MIVETTNNNPAIGSENGSCDAIRREIIVATNRIKAEIAGLRIFSNLEIRGIYIEIVAIMQNRITNVVKSKDRSTGPINGEIGIRDEDEPQIKIAKVRMDMLTI
tara:strand:+ start:2243 stop:2554 length:312 start_codon:yes stop_codon:yes gene_type:complete